MANNNQDRIDLLRKVYSKSEYTKIIDTEFNQLGQISVNEEEAQEVTVEQFFDYYKAYPLKLASRLFLSLYLQHTLYR